MGGRHGAPGRRTIRRGRRLSARRGRHAGGPSVRDGRAGLPHLSRSARRGLALDRPGRARPGQRPRHRLGRPGVGDRAAFHHRRDGALGLARRDGGLRDPGGVGRRHMAPRPRSRAEGRARVSPHAAAGDGAREPAVPRGRAPAEGAGLRAPHAELHAPGLRRLHLHLLVLSLPRPGPALQPGRRRAGQQPAVGPLGHLDSPWRESSPTASCKAGSDRCGAGG